MSKSESYIPAGYHTATPYIVVKGAAKALEFYTKAFGAVQTLRMDMPDGSVAHAEFKIGNSHIMISDENLQWQNKSPQTLGGTASSIMFYVPDCDAVYNRAVAEGATAAMPVMDQFYGDRSGTLIDPFGHKWHVSTNKETLTEAELKERMAGMFKKPECS